MLTHRLQERAAARGPGAPAADQRAHPGGALGRAGRLCGPGRVPRERGEPVRVWGVGGCGWRVDGAVDELRGVGLGWDFGVFLHRNVESVLRVFCFEGSVLGDVVERADLEHEQVMAASACRCDLFVKTMRSLRIW